MLRAFDQRRYLIPFRSQLLPHILTDTLVIGGGVAGARATLEAAKGGDVIVLTKGPAEISNTAWAQGGVASARGPGDSVDAHVEDTLTAGAGLCDEPAVRVMAEEGIACIEELLDWGMRFDKTQEGEYAYGREGAHSRSRILHTDGAATGTALARLLIERMRRTENVRVFEHCFALDLLTPDSNGNGSGAGAPGRVLGAITHHPKYGLQNIWARSTILASGGSGQVFRETTNPKIATGDGMAMAYRAGAAVADAEMMQFHPTTLYVAGAGRVLISEAVRGEGAYLLDREGVRFMPEYHEQAELAPRDVVSRAIMDRLARTQQSAVYLDVRHLGGDWFRKRFPSLHKELSSFDIDPGVDLIPVHPSAHYTIGGPWADLEGRTSLPGLLACGEAACNGVHGANRLASNSLLDGLVYGRRAGRIAAESNGPAAAPMRIVSDIRTEEHAELDLVDVRSSLSSTMWRNVGVERVGNRLADVSEMLNFWARYTMDVIFEDPAGWEVQNLLLIGALMTRGAHWRQETRGVHARSDFPETKDEFAVHALWTNGRDEPEIRPVQAGAVAAEGSA